MTISSLPRLTFSPLSDLSRYRTLIRFIEGECP